MIVMDMTLRRASQIRLEAAMFELIIYSLVTILPDYLYRRPFGLS